MAGVVSLQSTDKAWCTFSLQLFGKSGSFRIKWCLKEASFWSTDILDIIKVRVLWWLHLKEEAFVSVNDLL